MTSSTYYKSNNVRENVYEQSRRQEEINANKQQDQLDIKNMETLAEMAQAKKYSKLIKNTMGELINTSPELKKAIDIGRDILPQAKNTIKSIQDIIDSGRLNELTDKLNAIPRDELTKIQKIIIKDINNPEIKYIINETIKEDIALGKTHKEIGKSIQELIIGRDSKYKKELETLVYKAFSPVISKVKDDVKKERKKNRRR